MTQQPPVPQASQSPYPIEEPPHPRPTTDFNQVDWSRSEPALSLRSILDDAGVSSRTALGVGAAIGIGLLAGLAAAVFSSRSKPQRAPARRATTAKAATARAGKRKAAPRGAQTSASNSTAKRGSTRKPSASRSSKAPPATSS